MATMKGGRLRWGVEWGMEEEFYKGGKGRLRKLGNDDIMMMG